MTVLPFKVSVCVSQDRLDYASVTNSSQTQCFVTKFTTISCYISFLCWLMLSSMSLASKRQDGIKVAPIRNTSGCHDRGK